jgi:excisionase family DNA binding protein
MTDTSRVGTHPPRASKGGYTAEPALLRVEEAARILALGRSKTYELIARGELPSVRIGRAVRVPRNALQEWLRAQVTPHNNGDAPPDL